MGHYAYFARLSRDQKLLMWRELCRTRALELKIRYDVKESDSPKIPTVALLSLGEEAISLGAAFAADPKKDWLVPSHRSKGALMHFGITPLDDLRNHMCKANSPAQGRDGNIHYGSAEKHVVRFISHMAANIPTGIGIADGLKRIYEMSGERSEDMPAVLCFLGDGASSQGIFHEAIKFAAPNNLPVGIIIDNNQIATDTPSEEQAATMRLSKMAHGYNIRGEHVSDGNNIVSIYNHVARLIARARDVATKTEYVCKHGEMRAPFLLDCVTYRQAEHNEIRRADCVDPLSFIEWRAQDPVRLFYHTLLALPSETAEREVMKKTGRESGSMWRSLANYDDDDAKTWFKEISQDARLLFDSKEKEFTKEELDTIALEEIALVSRAYEDAYNSPDPIPNESLRKIFASEIVIPKERAVEPFRATARRKALSEERKSMISYQEAISKVLLEEFKSNPKITIFGEDVAGAIIEGEPRGGGVFKVTHDIVVDPKTDRRRIFNTPLAETAIAGVAIGHAHVGLIPIAEFQYLPFASVAISQFIDYLPGSYWADRMSIRAIFRLPCGGGRSAGDFHESMRLEASFYHTPGLKMVHPSTPADAMGLMRGALRDNSPVLFFESLWGYDSIVGHPSDGITSLGPAALRKEGKDLTVIAWGPRTWFSCVLPAVEKLEEKGASIELIDVRTLSPLDLDLLVSSAKKTHRVLIVHEDIKKGGVGQSIAQEMNDAGAWDYLLAKPEIVASEFCPVPQHPALWPWTLPSEEKVYQAAQLLLASR